MEGNGYVEKKETDGGALAAVPGGVLVAVASAADGDDDSDMVMTEVDDSATGRISFGEQLPYSYL